MQTIKDILRVTWEAIKGFWEELFILVLMNMLTMVPVFLLLTILYGVLALWSTGNGTLATVLMILAAVPLILLPPALAGLWNAANRVADELGIHWSDYFEGFRRYFWKSLGIALLNILVLGTTSVSIRFYAPGVNPLDIDPTISAILQMLVLTIAVVWLLGQMYFLAMLLEQTDQRLLVALRNSYVLLAARPGFSLLLALVLILIVALSTLLQLPWLLITWSLVAVVCNKAVKHLLIPFRKSM